MAQTASIIYQILDRYSGPMATISRQTNRFAAQTRKAKYAVEMLGRRMQSMSNQVLNLGTALGTAGAGLALKNVIGTAVTFEGALNKVEAITQATAEQMNAMRGQAERLGATTQFSAIQSAEAMTFLGMAGLKTTDIIKVMPGMLDLAAAGNLQLADAADIATNVLAAYQLPLSQIGHLSDVLAFAAANANTNVYEMASAMRNVAATAQLAGVSVEETSSMLMVLANAGIKGGEAGTQLMNAMRALTAMAPKTQKTLARLGINPRKMLDSQGKIKDLTGIVDQLAKRGATLGQMFSIFDIRGAKAMAILKESGGESLRDFTAQLEVADGTARRMAETLMKGAPGAIKRFVSALEGIKLAMATTILPVFTEMVEKMAVFMGNLQKANPELLKWGMLALTAATAMGAFVVPLGIIAASFGALLPILITIVGPIGLIAAGIGVLTVGFVSWTKSSHPVIQAVKDLGMAFMPLINFFRESVGGMMNWGKALHQIGFIVGGVIKMFEILVRVASAAITAVASGIIASLQFIKGDFGGMIRTLTLGGKSIAENIHAADEAIGGTGRYAFGTIGQGPLGPLAYKSEATKEAMRGQKQDVGITGEINVRASEGSIIERAEIIPMGGENMALMGA